MNVSEDFQRRAIKAGDEDFLQSLKDFLVDPSVVPLFNKADGSIDREKTLSLPCFQGYKS